MAGGKNWTSEEEKVVARYFNKLGVDYIVKRLKRSEESIRHRAALLGLTNQHKGNVRTARRRLIADAEDRMREIPADTRSYNQRVMGDPLPGRSALDKKRENGESIPA
jgi:hypothetical protein